MKCQKCGRSNANINYTRIINGRREDLHLCSDCAQEMNLHIDFNWQDMFHGFLEDFAEARSLAMPEMLGLNSFSRGWDSLWGEDFFEDVPFYGKNYLLETKEDEIEETLNAIQKKHQKQGDEEKKKRKNHLKEEKTEKKVESKKENEINQLKEKLQEYIQKEEYEKAAVLRDKIKELEK